MAEKKQYIKWILSQIQLLKEKEIISGDTASVLEHYYQAELDRCPAPKKIYSLVLGLIGIVMVASGVILFLNYNWDMFPKFLRIALAALPLAAGAFTAYFTLLCNKGQLWKEGSAILTSTGAGTLIAVLSQIYHTGGQLHEFMFLLLLLSLPLVYIFNSIGLASIYIFCSFFITSWAPPVWWKAFVLLLILPYLFYHLKHSSPWHVWCRLLVLVAAISFYTGYSIHKYYPLLPGITLCSLFLMCGMDQMKHGNTLFKNPWVIPAFVLQTVLLAMGSSGDFIFRFDDKAQLRSLETVCFVISNISLSGLFLYFFFRKHLTTQRCMSLLLILLTALPLVWKEAPMRVIYNVYFGMAGIIFIRCGIKKSSLLLFNGGAIMISVLTCCRFFDSDLGVLYRSAGLLLLGLGFILGNCFFIKFNKGEAK